MTKMSKFKMSGETNKSVQSIFLRSFTHSEEYFITNAELFTRLADTGNIFRMAFPWLWKISRAARR